MADSIADSVGITKLEIPAVETANPEIVESSEVPAPATASSNPDDQFDDISVFDTLNAKRSPKQDRSSKRVLRKSTIRLASTNEGLVTEATTQAEEEKVKEDQSKAEKLNNNNKKKSFKNFFGLLSFNNKSKTDETKNVSTVSTASCDTGERSSADATSNSTSFSTDANTTAILNPTATDHVSNPIKRESLTSPPKAVKSETEIVLPEENKPSGGSNSNSPMPNRKGTFNKIRSKSIHRVVSVRTYEQEKQQNHSITTLDTSSYDDISQATSSPTTPVNNNPAVSTSVSTAFQLFPSVMDDEQSPVTDDSIQRFSPTHEEPSTSIEKSVSVEDDTKTANLPPRRSSYEIVDQKGRKRSISAFADNAPIPPPPPPLKEELVEVAESTDNVDVIDVPTIPVVVQSPDGRRISITVFSKNAPIVPPPPLPPTSVSTNEVDTEVEEKVEENDGPFEETHEIVENDEVVEEFLDENNENEQFIEEEAVAEDVETFSTPPIAVVETSDGRRLSIKALTPGAPIVPPPPLIPTKRETEDQYNSVDKEQEEEEEEEEELAQIQEEFESNHPEGPVQVEEEADLE
eukprot:gene10940-11924_t